MLVLSGKKADRVKLTDNETGTEIVINFLKVTGNRVRVGYEAPKHVRIVRDNKPRVKAA